MAWLRVQQQPTVAASTTNARRDAYGLGVCGGAGVQAWAEKSTALSMNVLKKNLDSYKVRVTSNIVCEGVEKNDTHYLSKVLPLRRPALSVSALAPTIPSSLLTAAPRGELSSLVCEVDDVGGYDVLEGGGSAMAGCGERRHEPYSTPVADCDSHTELAGMRGCHP